jgi:hypothetical protein
MEAITCGRLGNLNKQRVRIVEKQVPTCAITSPDWAGVRAASVSASTHLDARLTCSCVVTMHVNYVNASTHAILPLTALI